MKHICSDMNCDMFHHDLSTPHGRCERPWLIVAECIAAIVACPHKDIALFPMLVVQGAEQGGLSEVASRT